MRKIIRFNLITKETLKAYLIKVPNKKKYFWYPIGLGKIRLIKSYRYFELLCNDNYMVDLVSIKFEKGEYKNINDLFSSHFKIVNKEINEIREFYSNNYTRYKNPKHTNRYWWK